MRRVRSRREDADVLRGEPEPARRLARAVAGVAARLEQSRLGPEGHPAIGDRVGVHLGVGADGEAVGVERLDPVGDERGATRHRLRGVAAHGVGAHHAGLVRHGLDDHDCRVEAEARDRAGVGVVAGVGAGGEEAGAGVDGDVGAGLVAGAADRVDGVGAVGDAGGDRHRDGRGAVGRHRARSDAAGQDRARGGVVETVGDRLAALEVLDLAAGGGLQDGEVGGVRG